MSRWGSLIALLLGAFVASPSFALPNEVAQEGMVLDADGLPMEGRHDVRVRIYPVAVGGAPVFDEVHQGVEFFEGYYFVAIGSIQPLSPSLFTRENLFVGITIDGGAELLPRVALRKVPAAMVADIALSVAGPIDVDSVAIGGQPVIDAQGRWVGDPTGLRGPAGAAGPAGPQGERGPEGPAGPGGVNANPQEVVPLVVRELEINPGLLPFIRKNANDSTTGTLTFDGGRIVMRSGGTANSLDLSNNNIIGVNALRIADPGPNEGISWDGTQAKIVVAGLADQNADGWLRLINDGGISLESTVRIAGDLSITGVISEVQRITATVADITTANIVNANITNLTGPNNRVNVNGALNLAADVIIGPGTNFQGVVRTGGVVSAGDIQGQNINATGSVTAAGHVTAGENAGRVVAGGGGIWVRDIQVFDGNGNLLRRPIYQCPQGSLFFGTDGAGLPRCVNVTCAPGSYFRGFDGGLNPVCQQDTGLAAIPANNCPPGQAVVAINAQGQTTCRAPRAAPQRCDEGQFVVGLDDDGSVICADAPEGGGEGGQMGRCAPDQVRPNVLLCGGSSRDVRTFLPPGYNLNLQNGCNPDAQTQVMFVSRGGAGQVGAQAAAWRAYVEAGGQIVTEWNVAHTVYNAIFQANVAQGPWRGNCQDNAMQVVKFNEGDRFWQVNDIPVIPANAAACGYDIAAFPEITPLGGWAANQVGLAYRDRGEGRVWLLEADWQDGEAAWLQQSTQLMQALATWCMGDAGDGGGGDLFEFSGPRNNVPDADLVGWERCHLSRYGDNNISLAQVQQECGRGDKIMYGCRQVGANTWFVLGQGERQAVFANTGNGNVTTRNNGLEWYYSDGWSLGFAPEGEAVSRNSCDTNNPGNNDRICWHSGGGSMTGGWRCGGNTGLNGNQNWERAIWYNNADGGGGGEGPPENLFTFQGVRQNTPDNALEGWRECYTSRYNENTPNLQQALDQDCDGEYIMYGCRPVGQANWNLLAMGERDQVFRDTGNGNATTRHNGVEWYFNTSWSLGFAPEGQPVSRNSCDTQGGQGELRMCWHSGGNAMNSGYRCGNSFLNGNNGWERRIWTANGGGGGGNPEGVYASCKQALGAGNRDSGVYRLRPPGEPAERRVYCDMTTDGGGWTLVGSTRDTTFNDQRSDYYDDLQRLDPAAGHEGIWGGLRDAPGGRFDMRFTCRDSVQAANAPMTVDLSFYNPGQPVSWYREITTGTDEQSCFSEQNGAGADVPPPGRRNNRTNQFLPEGSQWAAGYLEGEDSCGDTGDFTVDFNDRGMDSNQSDGTDWGEDDSSRKCGRDGLGSGQWFVWVRERGDFPGGGGGGGSCANNPRWQRVQCGNARWVWSTDRNFPNLQLANANRTLRSGCRHDAGNLEGLCSLDGTGWVSTQTFVMQGCNASWYHIGGQYTGNCGGHDGDTVRLHVLGDNDCYDY